MAVRSARLAADLQQSREQLVLAREEDRRRIRRDLHDGLGPVLGGVAMRLDAAGNALDRDPETTRRLVAQSRQDITDALADVRRLVHGLRPPALDDLGLLAALDQQAERMSSADLAVTVAAEDLPPLPGRGRGGGVPDRVGGAHQHRAPRPRPARRTSGCVGEPGRAARRGRATTAPASIPTSWPASGYGRSASGPRSSAAATEIVCPDRRRHPGPGLAADHHHPTSTRRRP